MENEMPPLEAIKSLCFVEEYGYGYEYEIIKKTFQQYKSIEDEYCVIDNDNLRRRLDLADRYGELSEQLGIDLTILFKALKNGIFVKLKYNDCGLKKDVITFLKSSCLSINSYNAIVYRKYLNGEDFIELPFKDYGKTWALTKEELE